MHQNPPFSGKNSNFFWGGGSAPSTSTVRPPIMKFWIRHCSLSPLSVYLPINNLLYSAWKQTVSFLLKCRQFTNEWWPAYRFNTFHFIINRPTAFHPSIYIVTLQSQCMKTLQHSSLYTLNYNAHKFNRQIQTTLHQVVRYNVSNGSEASCTLATKN